MIPASKVTSSCTFARTVCEDCLQKHITHSIEKQDGEDIRCICTTQKCSAKLKHRHVQRYASQETFRRYDEALLRITLERNDEFCWCATSGCGSGQLHVRQHDYPRMRCHVCRQNTCFTHRCAWHEGRSCQQYDRDASNSEEVALLQALEHESFQHCPKCRNGIEKTGGCWHMTCKWASCKHEFCWHCLAPMAEIRKNGSKSHKSSCRLYK